MVCTATVTSGTCRLACVSATSAQCGCIPYVNAGLTTTSEIDVDLRSRFDIGNFGGLSAPRSTGRASIEYEDPFSGTALDLAGTHGTLSMSGDSGDRRDRAVE